MEIDASFASWMMAFPWQGLLLVLVSESVNLMPTSIFLIEDKAHQKFMGTFLAIVPAQKMLLVLMTLVLCLRACV